MKNCGGIGCLLAGILISLSLPTFFAIRSVQEQSLAKGLRVFIEGFTLPQDAEIIDRGSSVGGYRAGTGNPVDLFGYILVRYSGDVDDLRSVFGEHINYSSENPPEKPPVFIYPASEYPELVSSRVRASHPVYRMVGDIPEDDRTNLFYIYSVIMHRQALIG